MSSPGSPIVGAPTLGKARVLLHAFNVGVHDTTALPRIDLERMRLAAETQTNLLPLAVGPAFLRPGLKYISTLAAETRLKEFVFGATDAAVMQFSDLAMRVVLNDVAITRTAVSTVMTSGTFAAGAGWTLTASDGATSTISGGYLNLTALGRGSLASATQTVSVALLDRGIEHGLRIEVERGPVTFRCGSASGLDDYIEETELRTGTHSLAFTPTGANFYIEFKSDQRQLRRVNSIEVEAGGVMVLTTPWATAELGLMRFAQSADVVFVACADNQPRRIERRSTRSWSVVVYQPDDGPFTISRTRRVRLQPNVTEGNGTLTADKAFFSANHVGALFRLFHEGNDHTFNISGAGQFTEPVRVTGVNTALTRDRDRTYTISGTWVGNIHIQRSFDEADVGYLGYGASIAANVGPVLTRDDEDNAIIYYRMGFPEGQYTSGTATINVEYDGGGDYGICRVVGYTSPTVVDIEVLSPFTNVKYTDRWQEGEWSAARVWPSAVAFSDGRLFLSGEDRLWGSVSDAFDSFDEELEGEAGPINRSIATGGVNDTQWLAAPQRLLVGTEGTIAVVKSSSLDEPLTSQNISIRDSSTTGAGPIDPARIDNRVLFTDRSGKAIYELVFDGGSGDYAAGQMSKLTTDIFSSGVREIAVQRRPDTRVWVVMNDGTCICILYEPQQEVLAFVPMETDGAFESACVIPGATQDIVYFAVRRTINGSTVRYFEKMALDSEVVPGTRCYVMDAYATGSGGGASSTLTVGTHLIGETVVVWADGAPVETSYGVRGEYVVNGSGEITLANPVTNWVAGLPYRGRYKSARLGYGVEGGTAMLSKGIIEEFGLVLADYARAGIKVGTDFTTMYQLPRKVDGSTKASVTSGVIADEPLNNMGAQWQFDSRYHMEINSPYCAKFLGLVLKIQANG